MDVTLFGMVRLAILFWKNADSPMDVTPFGMVTPVSSDF